MHVVVFFINKRVLRCMWRAYYIHTLVYVVEYVYMQHMQYLCVCMRTCVHIYARAYTRIHMYVCRYGVHVNVNIWYVSLSSKNWYMRNLSGF